MKLNIKIKLLNDACYPVIKGDWIDLKARTTVTIPGPRANMLKRNRKTGDSVRTVEFYTTRIPLGIAMQLPKGYEAVVLPRSGTPSNLHIMLTNSEGVIDNAYCGDNDEWKFEALALQDTTIKRGDRICQFRIQLSQSATVFQKLKWLFSSGVTFEFVETLGNKDRGGFNSTGIR